ncbi:MAG: UbiD family decarboxylase, partial [Chloroflexota bacterium]
MSLREHLKSLENRGELLHIKKPISKVFEISGLLKAVEPRPVLFEKVCGSNFQVMGNLMCTKAQFADYLGITAQEIIPKLADAIEHLSAPEVVSTAPCQEVIMQAPDLDQLPIPFHFEHDGGNYITSGVMVSRHPEYGQNLDFHRCMQFSKTEMAVRVVKSRHFDTFLADLGQLDVAICIGVNPNVMVAAATSVALGQDELQIANTLEALKVVPAKSLNLLIPAEAEFVIEGTIYRDRRHAEGPFVDLTETMDVVRQEPVLVVSCITHRRDALWQALLPGALEHKLLMGMPREPTIFREVNKVVRCLDVNVNPGACSWLHALVQIEKHNADDGKNAIQAAFRGHRSCKHVYVVDQDIDIYDPLAIEWAMATRFQADQDLIIFDREQGSSLDPSAEPDTYLTCKAGFDLTKALDTQGKGFDKVPY